MNSTMRSGRLRHRVTSLLFILLVAGAPGSAGAAGHRDAPLAERDGQADIADVFAFRSYGGSPTPRVTLIMTVDALVEPGSGANHGLFDPEILYAIKIDNNNDAIEDIVFQFRFRTEIRDADQLVGRLGAGAGVGAPPNSPPPVTPGEPVVPPRITTLDGAGSEGLSLRQSYTLTMIKGGVAVELTSGVTRVAVPANLGPRTMDYGALFNEGIYALASGITVFAGAVDDPFWTDLGALADTLNVRAAIAPGVLSPAQDAALLNMAPDTFSGFGVKAIAIDVPVSMLTRTGAVEPASSTAATIGVWATTSRPRTKVQASLPGGAPVLSTNFTQIQRMGNPHVNHLFVTIGSKDKFSQSLPKDDAQFAPLFLDPLLARILNALTGGALAIPDPPRVDLLPLLQYVPPIAASGSPAGPIADMLRLNTGVAPTLPQNASRLGLLGGDAAGFPNGRRLFDDVTDLMLRFAAGVLNPSFNVFPNNRLGDGVNVNDAPYRPTFPYLADAPSGRDRRHLDPGEPGCTGGVGAPCAP